MGEADKDVHVKPEDLQSMSGKDLRKACQDLSLPTAGPKSELMARIAVHAESVLTQEPPQSGAADEDLLGDDLPAHGTKVDVDTPLPASMVPLPSDSDEDM